VAGAVRIGALLAVAFCAGCGTDPSVPTPDEPPELFAGGEGTVFTAGPDAFSFPMPLLDRDAERAFFKGQALFRDDWVVAPASTDSRDGLGPLFNARACIDCHAADGRGSPPEEGEPLRSLVLRMSVPGHDEAGAPIPEPTYGEQFQPFGIPGVPGEGEVRVHWEIETGTYADGTAYELRRPVLDFGELAAGPLAEDARLSLRIPRRLVGLGLLEAIPQSDLDDLGGVPNQVPAIASGSTALGRIGWKATQPSVRQQAAKAFGVDFGLTTSLFGEQPCSEAQVACKEAIGGGSPEVLDVLLDNVAVYAATLGVPAPRDLDDPERQRGKAVFEDLGCARCHVPRHVTGEHPTIVGLAGQTIWPYTDLRLHDMGEGLDDGRPVFDADGSLWRTPPLWGIGLIETVNGHLFLLHDGRARGFAEAILWHGGEADEPRARFVAAPEEDRAALIHFLESL